MGRGDQGWEGLTQMLCHWVILGQAKGLSGQGSLSQRIPVTTPNPRYSSLSDNSANPSWKSRANDTIPNMRLLWASSWRTVGRKEQHQLRSHCSMSALCFAGGKEREPTCELPILTRKNYSWPSETKKFAIQDVSWNWSNYIQYTGNSRINV